MAADQHPLSHMWVWPEGPSPLVSAGWLAAHLADVQVVDARWYLDPGRSGWAAYRAGHVPGAVWLDVDTDLSAPASLRDGRHPLPTPEAFAAALGAKGIADGRPVVAYDDAGAPARDGTAYGGGASGAARLWWLLHSIGEPVAVLDGGLAAWQGALSTDVPAPVPVERGVRPWPADRFVTADELAASRAAVFDARSAERYAHGGEVDPRPGHIPGAHSAPWTGNLDADGRFLPPEVLRERFAAAADSGAVAYCGSGVTACHDLLAMTLAGFTELALYPGSWSQWGADRSRPATTGSAR